jgi:hypothetical protein
MHGSGSTRSRGLIVGVAGIRTVAPGFEPMALT